MPEADDEEKAHCGYMGDMARAKGYSRGDFIRKIVDSTIERYNLN